MHHAHINVVAQYLDIFVSIPCLPMDPKCGVLLRIPLRYRFPRMTKVLLPLSYRRWVGDITISDRRKEVSLDMRAVNKHASCLFYIRYWECRATRQFEDIAHVWSLVHGYFYFLEGFTIAFMHMHIFFRSLHSLLFPIWTFVQLRYPVRECECAYITIVRFFIAVNKLLCVVSDKRSLPFLLYGKLQNTAPFCASCATT